MTEQDARDSAGWLDFADIPHGSILYSTDKERLKLCTSQLFIMSQQFLTMGMRKQASQCGIKGYELRSYYD